MDTEQQRGTVSDYALLALRGFLDRIEQNNGSLGELANLMQDVISFNPIPLVHSVSHCDAFKQAQQLLNDMEAASDLAKRLFDVLGEQVQMAKHWMKSISLRNGISSLPDDTLSYILQYATRPDELEEGPLVRTEDEVATIYEAVSLSHVCSRFRSLILNNPRIWNFLSDQFPKTDMVLHCIKYAKRAPLYVNMGRLGRTHVGLKFENIVLACLTSTARWESLTFGVNRSKEKRNARNYQNFSDNVSALSRLTNGFEFPSLVSLRIKYKGVKRSIDLRNEEFHPHLCWSLPSLKKFTFIGGIPLPFNNSVKRISIKYRCEGDALLDMRHVQTFFASCTSLQSATLQLCNWRSPIPCNTAKIPGVERICFLFDDCAMDAIRTICGALYFQDAREMILKLNIPSHQQDHQIASLPDYGVLIEELLLQHPYADLKSLALRLVPCMAHETRAPYLPPFTKLRNLEHLTLSLFLDWKNIELLEVPEGIHVPALRSLSLEMDLEDWHHVSSWVVTLMARMKTQGDLEDRFEMLRIHKLKDNDRKPSELEGEIHDYLPDHKIVIEEMHDD